MSPEGLLREVQAAEAQTERYQENVQALIERYHGPWYYGPLSDESASAFTENHYYEWATLMVPRLAFTSPRVSCKSRRGGSQQTAVRAIRHGVNRWVRDVNLRALQERVVMDLEFSYAVILTTLIQHPGDEEVENPRMWPHMMRVPPENFFWDCFARSFEECQFTGHQWITSKQELLDRARMDRDLPEDLQEGWDLAAVQRLVESDGMMDARKAMKDRTLESRIQREEVVLRDVWVPGYRLPGSDARHNGTLFTISDIGEYVSMPKPYYG
ncbi:MAG TPA: hypothetical protein VF653_00945, partial [Methylomirabilota bacterium]